MHVSEKVRRIAPAPIDIVNARVRGIRAAGGTVINLGQAVPGFSIVPEASENARQVLDEEDTHIYSADAGILPLREALSKTMWQRNKVEVDPQREVIITAGANQAFMLAMLTLLEPGDKVLLPSPFFLNHAMAVRIAGGVPIEIPLSEESGFQLRLEDVVPYLDTKPRALVIVSPNNPTGAVYDPVEIQQIAHTLAPKGIALISDETYQYFTYKGSQHFSPASLPEVRPQVITIGSFSKTFNMTGWRVGFLIAEPDFIQEAIKVQDTMLICAPVIAQKAVLGVLQEIPRFLEQRLEILGRRRKLFIERLADIPQLNWHPTNGGFFAFTRVEECRDSMSLALNILDSTHVATIPGSAFGQYSEGYLRLSYGSVELADLEEACNRLAHYFKTAPKI
ncbi:MAG TPA: aminotransferase class I/II-fold pyridoxal phosphate-dependent enzyme [Ktedonobacteraceae bacterium]|nr:aminotransferase class I/II-fold pyridoxal phosphate-dependent enzyme [Ktedonobacteraceae bacterium]